MRWLKNFLLVIVFLAAVRYWLNTKSYIFEEKSIIKLVQRYGGKNNCKLHCHNLGQFVYSVLN